MKYPTLKRIRLLLLAVMATLGVATAGAQSVARIWNEELLDAIRRDVPNPPGHARNLHHTAIAMYNAWAAYDPTAVGYQFNQKVSPLPVDIELARREAISYAAYRVLRARFLNSVGAGTTLPSFDTALTNLVYSPTFAQAAVTNGSTPAEVGRRIGQMVLNWGATDGFSNTTHPQAYNSSVNANMSVPLSVLGENLNNELNVPLGYGIPEETNPNLWQPLALSSSVTQNGIPIPGGAQGFVGVQGLSTQAFSLTRPSNTVPWIDIGPPSQLGGATDATYKSGAIDVLTKSALLNDSTLVDISPAGVGNNPLGTDNDPGYPTNPVAGGSYAPNEVPLGDFARVLAEYWADGPHSETPPGHWHVIANEVADMAGFQKRLRGVGPIVNDLEWDVKTYMSLAGGVHDAACAAWALKRYYSGPRPITMIRYMCSKGQSSNPSDTATYHPQGIPLVPDVVEVITADTAAPGGKHENIWDVAYGGTFSGTNYIGMIAVKSWPGEAPGNPPASSGLPAVNQSTVRWMLGKDWLPFQRKTFNTPAFPGYISGHSTFSRAAAEVLALITGSPYFPGGFHHHTVAANSLLMDLGPSVAVDLQWASYYDAADQAGQSRRWGGIHPVEDDLPARQVGSQAGISAFTKAEKFWTGTIQSESINPIVTLDANGNAVVTWTQVPGRLYAVKKSTNFATWTEARRPTFAHTTSGTYTEVAAPAGIVFQIIETLPSIARVWNEELMGAIRRNVPHPPAHARNLHHVALAMYNAWAAYDVTAVGYPFNEKVSPLPGDIDAARREAISYAAYRVLRSRFATGNGAATSLASFDTQLTNQGYSPSFGQAAVTNGSTPGEVGRRIGQMILNWGLTDGFSGTALPQPYDAALNPNMALPISALGFNLNMEANMPMGFGIPNGTDPNLWQPLALSSSITQNGIPIPGGTQSFVGVQGLSTKAFSLSRASTLVPYLDPFGGPSRASTILTPSASDAEYKENAMDVLRKSALLNDPTIINASPGAMGNSALGTDNGTGFPVNPVTGGTYAANNVPRSDFYRVLAEYWADGPNSETPPGHWHVLANELSDDPALVKKIRGTGPTLGLLEWDIKTYFSISGATHDAACAAWALKRYYSGARPITMIRWLCSNGQSSDPQGPSFSPYGIPLETDVTEVITLASTGVGGKHEQIWDVATNSYQPGSNFIGMIAVKSWPGEHPGNLPAPSIATNQSTVRWMLGKDWLPFQRKTFNTPAFPGYISGHSTFSRAAAEALTLLTGSPNFPGGFGHHTIQANSMQIDLGPSQNVDLQWCTYYDAADQAGQSRRWGGIHPYEDDFDGRVIGSQAGISAFTKAEKFWTGTIQSESINPTVTYNSNGSATITWPQVLGRIYKLQKTTDFNTWTDVGESEFAATTSSTSTDSAPAVGTSYRVIETTPSVARVWNELLMGAIRRNIPHPPAHARNIFHTASAMYGAWAAYDSTAIGYMQNEKASPIPSDPAARAAARHEAISYAAYRVLRSRFATGNGAAQSLASFDAQLTAFGYSPSLAQAPTNISTSPAELGKRVGQAILDWGAIDGFSGVNFPQVYDSSVNPNMSLPLSVLGFNLNMEANMPLGYGVPPGTNPNLWQPLALSSAVTQNGVPIPGGVQPHIGVQGLSTQAFSLTRTDNTKPWIDPFGGPSILSTGGNVSPTDAAYKDNFMDVIRKTAQLNDNVTVNISPAASGNNPLGADTGAGYPLNPVTNQPYPANNVLKSDFVRVLAEYWADGPHSETPPGHWQVLANEVSEMPALVKKIRGTGPTVDDLEWDVKTYFTVGSATHDAACAAWALKRYYSGVRPITAIRYMCSMGQSSNPSDLATYHPEGIPLETNVVEVITLQSSAPGEKHEWIWDVATNAYQPGSSYIGMIALRGWPGEHPSNLPAPSIATNQSTVRWMLGKDWLPFQRKTFNTPAFPGYISGHSTFSRAAAEALTLITGSPNFPGGFHHHTVAANSMQIDLGPSTPVDLQWCTYYDAADQAGVSRRWGGIHPYEDDYHGRTIGRECGISAATLAFKYFDGSLLQESVIPMQAWSPNGTLTLTSPARRGLWYQWEYTTDLQTWIPLTLSTQATGTMTTVTDNPPAGQRRFYRVRFVAP